jgi:predicted dehydrogenase
MSIRVGIIGCGGISGFHISGYRKAGAEIVCVADADESRAKSMGENLGCRWTTDYHQLLNEPGIQAISICLPNYLHREVAEAALSAGKHILCEKTMTTNLPDAKALVEAVEKSGLIFQIAYMKRFFPAAIKARELVPRLGKLMSGLVRVYHPQSRDAFKLIGTDFWLFDHEKGGGGVLVHSGSHMLDLMRFLVGDPVSVDAKCHRIKGMDFYNTAYFQMASDFTMFFESSWLDLQNLGVRNNGWDEKIEITGERGRLELFTMWWTRPDEEVPFVRFYSADDNETHEIYPPTQNAFEQEVVSFVRSVESGKQGAPDVHDGYMVQAIIDAVYRAGDSGERVEIERLAAK